MRRATSDCRTWTYERLISIHALLAESDPHLLGICGGGDNFYPRSPCGERPERQSGRPQRPAFLSTLSLRRATSDGFHCGANVAISIHALLAESDNINSSVNTADQISIHALLAESDLSMAKVCQVVSSISIHALLAESDFMGPLIFNVQPHFYPRSPCGERPPRVLRHCTTYLFLSTLSLRRATAPNRHPCPRSRNFYPRSPCGERPTANTGATTSDAISIHALLAESDYDNYNLHCTEEISIHALLAESDGLGWEV